MPRLPVGLGSDAQLPATGGLRGGTVGLPVAQEPMADLGAATLPARGLADVGGQLEQAGQYVVQADAYQAQKGRAQAALDSTLGFQDFAQQFQPLLAKRQQEGDYQTLAKDTVQLGNQVADKVALERNLSPEAKALFREKTQAALTHAQASSLEVERTRFHQNATFAMANEVHQVQQDAMAAQDLPTIEAHLGRLYGTLQQGVTRGYLDAKVGASMYNETKLSVFKDWGTRTVDAQPIGSYQELLGLASGQPATTPAFQNLPPQFIDPLLQHAAVQVQRMTHFADLQKKQVLEVRKQQQDANAGQLTAQLFEFKPLPENLSKIDATLETIRQGLKDGRLAVNEGQQMLTMAQGYAEKARTYVPVDNYAIAKDLRVQLASAQTVEASRALIPQIMANQAALTGETYQALMKDIESRSNALHPLNSEGYKDGVKRIMWYAGIDANAPLPMLAQQLRTAEQVATANALLAYQLAVSKMTPDQIRTDALPLADKMIQEHMRPTNATAAAMGTAGLSQTLQFGGPNGKVVPNDAWALDALSKAPGASEDKYRQFKEFQAFRKLPKGLEILQKEYGPNPEKWPVPGAPGPYEDSIPSSSSTLPTPPVAPRPPPPSVWQRIWTGAPQTPVPPPAPSSLQKEFPVTRPERE